jgi:hypothetical protein
MPTLRTSEFTVLQTVGLDAAVVSARSGPLIATDKQLLNFYRMAFVLFSVLAVCAAVVLMPLNLFVSFRNSSFANPSDTARPTSMMEIPQMDLIPPTLLPSPPLPT